jgi:outer membrane murein-binding lipoprotein Lpp
VTAILAWFLSNPTVLAIGFGVIAAAGAWFKGSLTGAKRERDRQAAKDLASAQDRLEMDREATAVERQTTGMTDEQAKQEAAPWVRH